MVSLMSSNFSQVGPVTVVLAALAHLKNHSNYAPNFKEVEEAYWLGPIYLSEDLSVRLSFTLALGQEWLQIGS